MSYQSDTQKLRTKKVKEHSSIVDEKLLSERVYYGDQTHVYVGYLRAFKSGYFEGTNIKKITDIAKLAHIRMDFRGIMQSAWTRKG